MIVARPQVFVMMPFRSVTKPVRDAIKDVLFDLDCDCKIADEVYLSNKITDTIEILIRDAHFCICDISGKNPNVAWEFGYACALKKNVIVLAQGKRDLYFDIQNNPVIYYRNDQLNLLKAELKSRIEIISADLQFSPLDYANGFSYPDMLPVAASSSVQQTPYDFLSLISYATKHILLAGQNLGFIVQTAKNRNEFKKQVTSFLDKSPDSQVDIMICDEKFDPAIKTWEYVLETDEYSRHLNESVLFFSELKANFDDNDKYRGRFLVKKFPFVPLSITFIDPEEVNGIAVITPNGYQRSNIAKPCFVISARDNKTIFNSYWQQHYYIFTAKSSIEINKLS